jgi:hypothetical protein
MAANPIAEGFEPQTEPDPAPQLAVASLENLPEPANLASAEEPATTADANEPRHEAIACAAYFRAQARGFAPGCELEDWLAAEQQIGAH